MTYLQSHPCGCDYDHGQWFPCGVHRHLEEEDLPEAVEAWPRETLQRIRQGTYEHPEPLPRSVRDDEYPPLRLVP